jgi:hypothetical protein
MSLSVCLFNFAPSAVTPRTKGTCHFSSEYRPEIGVFLLLENINRLYESVLMALLEKRDGTLCRGLNVLTFLGG